MRIETKDPQPAFFHIASNAAKHGTPDRTEPASIELSLIADTRIDRLGKENAPAVADLGGG
jgi:hypothetical protein